MKKLLLLIPLLFLMVGIIRAQTDSIQEYPNRVEIIQDGVKSIIYKGQANYMIPKRDKVYIFMSYDFSTRKSDPNFWVEVDPDNFDDFADEDELISYLAWALDIGSDSTYYNWTSGVLDTTRHYYRGSDSTYFMYGELLQYETGEDTIRSVKIITSE